MNDTPTNRIVAGCRHRLKQSPLEYIFLPREWIELLLAEQARADREHARADHLAKYAVHQFNCELSTDVRGDYNRQGLGGKENRKCTCGLIPATGGS